MNAETQNINVPGMLFLPAYAPGMDPTVTAATISDPHTGTRSHIQPHTT